MGKICAKVEQDQRNIVWLELVQIWCNEFQFAEINIKFILSSWLYFANIQETDLYLELFVCLKPTDKFNIGLSCLGIFPHFKWRRIGALGIFDLVTCESGLLIIIIGILYFKFIWLCILKDVSKLNGLNLVGSQVEG